MDWNGTVLVTGTGLRTIDEDADGNVDLFVIENETGFVHVDVSGYVLAVTPREQTDIGDHITSRTVALMDPLEDGSYRLSLLDLTSGDRTTLEGSYATTSPIREGNRYTGLFYASYAENGELYCRVIREDGAILLSGLSDLWTRQGDAFYTDDGTIRGLIRLDGTWLYQEPVQS